MNHKQFKTIEIKRSIFQDNLQRADLLRQDLKSQKTLLLNLMSSPGSGKTSTLMQVLPKLLTELKVAVMEADIDSDVDAQAISATGAKVIQLHTGGMCHLDADMTRQGIDEIGTQGMDMVILENVGNLVCPAEFDTGAGLNVMILSVPEGDDKPLKYPLMFSVCDVLLINKIDTLAVFDFDTERCVERVKKLNPDIRVLSVSAKTGEGIDAFVSIIKEKVAAWKDDEIIAPSKFK